MNHDSLLNQIGDVEYLMMDIPQSVSVQSVKLDENGIEIILQRGIEDFAEDNTLELAEEVFPAENGLPTCLARLVVKPELNVRVWQFDDIEEAVTE